MTAQKTASRKASEVFSDEEKAAMRDAAEERRAAASTDPEAEVLAKIAEMKPDDRAMAERIHALVKAAVPDIEPRTWYGMPAYAKGGNTICFFQSAQKFKTRYATLGFSDKARLDDGDLWPNAFAVQKMTPAVEKRITQLIKQAVG
ncbi:MAG TPA: DUF1801 domain-containing protein [Candidatus Dormibacteraeota bacterium]